MLSAQEWAKVNEVEHVTKEQEPKNKVPEGLEILPMEEQWSSINRKRKRNPSGEKQGKTITETNNIYENLEIEEVEDKEEEEKVEEPERKIKTVKKRSDRKGEKREEMAEIVVEQKEIERNMNEETTEMSDEEALIGDVTTSDSSSAHEMDDDDAVVYSSCPEEGKISEGDSDWTDSIRQEEEKDKRVEEYIQKEFLQQLDSPLGVTLTQVDRMEQQQQ